MIALCEFAQNYDADFWVGLAALVVLLVSLVFIYLLWRIFVTNQFSLGTNVLGLDPESDCSTGSQWNGPTISGWKLALYSLLMVLTLIY